MANFHLTEPHPTLTTPYVYAGRGGAGNAMRVSPSQITDGQTATGPASLVKLSAPSSANFYATGRGGAGNMKKTERAMFSFDEELQQEERLRSQQAPIFHVGRGGAGNLIDKWKSRASRQGSASSSSSNESEKEDARQSTDSAWKWMARPFSHH